jgi:hypothetical protein
MDLRDELLAQLDALLAEGQRVVTSYRLDEWSYASSRMSEADIQAFVTSGLAALERIAGKDSEFYRNLPPKPRCLQALEPNDGYPSALLGALTALRRAVADGLLVRLERRVRANVYDDFLVQARELLDAGYHVPAMVLVGGVLEDHLRKLCTARGLTWNGSGSLSKYNDALREKVYDQPAWRRIQALADLRNKAAHGQGAEVRQDDMEDAHRYVGRFLADYPA